MTHCTKNRLALAEVLPEEFTRAPGALPGARRARDTDREAALTSRGKARFRGAVAPPRAMERRVFRDLEPAFHVGDQARRCLGARLSLLG
jgi:hypothetical protein